MKPRICVCCGQAMAEGKNALSRNPNICASCSSLADGMDSTDISGAVGPMHCETGLPLAAMGDIAAAKPVQAVSR